MDDRRFDHLTRSLAQAGSRRTLIKGLLGLGGSAVIGGMVHQSEALAARRPAPTPAPIRCPGTQVWNGTACACTIGTTCGPACCTGASQCCDNACCDGTCYGEELCCPAGYVVCNGQCLPPGACEQCREGAAECVIPEGGTSILLCVQGTWQEFECVDGTFCISSPEGSDFCEITT